jgi:hypothetical protein
MSEFGSTAEAPVLLRPYAERQLIAVVSDAAAAAARKEASTEKSTEKGIDRATSLKIAKRKVVGKDSDASGKAAAAVAVFGTVAALVRSVPTTLGVAAGAAGAAGGSVLHWLARRESDTLTKLNQLRDEGINVLPVSNSEAKALILPVGHPRDKVLYVGHPAIPTIYYTAASFHIRTFEHKFSEAVRILTTLGATQYEVERESGWWKEFATNLSGPFGTTGVQVGAEVDKTKSSESRIHYIATLSGNESPTLPKQLVWYPHEPLWQEVAQARLHYGLEKFNLTLRYEDDYGINAGLKLAVEQIGLDVGGKFLEHQSTVWRIVGTFGKPASVTANKLT